ncbi:MAG: type II toxin-antitoxin system MqsA family antitoxin [Clostridia bacterium]
MNCFMCKGGHLKEQLKNYIADLDDCVIIVKHVPSLVCEQCGEAYYTDEVATQLEKIVDTMEKFVKEVAIVEYSKMTA